MSDPRRPMTSAQTEVRRSIAADATDIPVISTTGFRVDADKQVGDEFVRCAGFGVDQFGWPVLTGCQRGVAQEDGGSEPRPWPGGTPVFEVGWTAVDILTEIPVPTADMEGRQFQYRDEAGQVFAFSVVVNKDNIPEIDWVNDPDAGVPIELEPAIEVLPNILAVAVDAAGSIYTSSSVGLLKHDSGFALLWDVGPPPFYESLATDGTHLYGTIGSSDTVEKRLCSDGSFVASWGGTGDGDGQFQSPRGIATNGVHVWITDQSADRIQKFTVNGTFVSKFGLHGTANGQFSFPREIALDGTGNVYVADSGNHRVQKFNSAHTHLLTFGEPGRFEGQFSVPEGIVVGSDGRIWVVDRNSRVQVFDAAGNFLGKAGSRGTQFKQIGAMPRQLAMTPEGVGFVADGGNGRLSTFRIVPKPFTPVVDSPVAGDVLVYDGAGWVNAERDQAATIATGAITLSSGAVSAVVLDTEGGAASDTLDTINGGVGGQIVVFGQAASARDVTVAEGGNIQLAGSNFNIATSLATITLVCRAAGGDWREVARSANP